MAVQYGKVSGIIVHAEPMRESYTDKDGNKHYEKPCSIESTNDKGYKSVVNFRLKDQHINQFADLIAYSYNKKEVVTVTLDPTCGKANAYANNNCFKVEQGDTIERLSTQRSYDASKPIVDFALGSDPIEAELRRNEIRDNPNKPIEVSDEPGLPF